MNRSDPPIIDMNPDGSFAGPRSRGAGFSGSGFSGARFYGTRLSGWPLGGIAALVVFAAVTLAMALFFLWLLMWLLPVAFGAALITYGALRVRNWWLSKSARPPSVYGVWNR